MTHEEWFQKFVREHAIVVLKEEAAAFATYAGHEECPLTPRELFEQLLRRSELGKVAGVERWDDV